MKHAVSNKKKVSPLPRKSYVEPKKATLKSGEKAVVKSRQSNSNKAVSAKSEPTSALLKTSVSKSKTAAPENKSTAAKRKTVSPEAKPKAAASKQNLKQKAVKIAPPTATKTAKISAPKTKPTPAVKQKPAAKNVAAKIKTKAMKAIEKPSARKTAAKVSPEKTTAKITPSNTKTPKISPDKTPPTVRRTKDIKPKVQAVKSKAQTTKTGAAKTVKSNKIVENIQSRKIVKTSAKKASAPKIEAKAVAKKIVRQSPKVKAATKKNDAQKLAKTQKAVSATKPAPKPLQQTSAKTKPQPQPQTPAAKVGAAPKTAKPSARKVAVKPAVKIKNGRIVLPPLVKVKAVEKPVEVALETVPTPAPKPRVKKAKSFGAATFRGARERYDFQVFPVDGEFEDAAAVFVISRRVVDRHERAHHRMVCIGQTASVLKELKKHRKGKCFRDHQVNAISVLREEDEQKRLKIEADLKSAHRIPCPH